MPRDKAKRRAAQRRWYWKTHKGGMEPPDKITEFDAIDQYEFRRVPNAWRDMVPFRERTNMREIDSPLVADLMLGKTLLVDIEVNERGDNPYRCLYAYFRSRGFRFRAHIIDDIDNEKYRCLLLWIEPYKIERFNKKAA